MVSGAGNREVAPGTRHVDQPDFPEIYLAEAIKGGEFLDLPPSADGGRSGMELPVAISNVRAWGRAGHLRLGAGASFINEGVSNSSFEGFAVPLVDKVEQAVLVL